MACPCACCVTVAPDELAALEFMGSFKRILMPGFHCVMPGSTIRKKSTRVTQNIVVTETKTKDNVFVKVAVAVQQEVHSEKAYEAIYKLSNPKGQIDSYVSDVVRAHVPNSTLDDLFDSKEEIANDVKERLTSTMTEFGYKIHECLVTDIDPDKNVKSAMNQINAQRRLRMAANEKAEADKIILIKAAEAEAESKFLAGQGTARSRAAIVDGLREAVCGKDNMAAMSARDVTELLITTQYLDTMEKMSTGPATTLFMPHNASIDDIRSIAAGGQPQKK